MATTISKGAGSILTPAEAAEAAAAFTAPQNYEFHHWSSSDASDIEVTGLNAGGSGVAVSSNTTFYPVITSTPAMSMIYDGTTLYLNYNRDNVTYNHYAAGYNTTETTSGHKMLVGDITSNSYNAYLAGANNICCFPYDGTLKFKGNYSGVGMTIDGMPSTNKYEMSYSANSTNPAVNFGVIEFPSTEELSVAVQKAYRVTSDIDNMIYELHMQWAWLHGDFLGTPLDSVMIYIDLYKYIDGQRTKLEQYNYLAQHRGL